MVEDSDADSTAVMAARTLQEVAVHDRNNGLLRSMVQEIAKDMKVMIYFLSQCLFLFVSVYALTIILVCRNLRVLCPHSRLKQTT